MKHASDKMPKRRQLSSGSSKSKRTHTGEKLAKARSPRVKLRRKINSAKLRRLQKGELKIGDLLNRSWKVQAAKGRARKVAKRCPRCGDSLKIGT